MLSITVIVFLFSFTVILCLMKSCYSPHCKRRQTVLQRADLADLTHI